VRLVGPIVEGDAEERVVPLILGWLGVKCRPPLRAQGKPDLIKRAATYAELQFHRGASEVLFCFDADGLDYRSELEGLAQSLSYQIDQRLNEAVGPPEQRVAELLRSLREAPLTPLLPVHELEAWLLADERALANVVGTSVPRIANPEADPHPDSSLDAIFRRAGLSGYRKREHSVKITQAASDRAWRRCPSYERGLQQFR
jgi:hypothetical protein